MIPTFGEKQIDKKYEARYGVYAIITRKKNSEIVLVQAPNGAYFLPGGEIEGNEDHNEALKRELIEELGFEVLKKEYLGQADEYFFSRHRNTYYHNPAYIYNVSNYKIIGAPTEDFNNIEWFSIDTALKKLKRGSHQWGVKQWQKTL